MRLIMPGRQRLRLAADSKKPAGTRTSPARDLARPSHCSACPDHWGAVMQRTLRGAIGAILAAILIVCVPVGAGATSRIKDFANIEGVRQNQLIGYGLVV